MNYIVQNEKNDCFIVKKRGQTPGGCQASTRQPLAYHGALGA